MSLHFLLDGYNIIHKMPFNQLDSLEDQRNRLIRWVETQNPQGSRNNRVTIIFDGQSGFLNHHQQSFVEVLFSSEGSADDKIKKMVDESLHQKNMVVVTDDRAIQIYVRSLGTKIIGVDEFLKDAAEEKKTIKNPKEKKEFSKNISKTLEYKINEEFKEIWLKKKP